MAETFAESQALQEVAQQRFPSLSPDDAYLALFHEICIKYPAELAKNVGLDGAELLAIASTSRNPLDLIRMARLGTGVGTRLVEFLKASPDSSQTLPANLTTNVGLVAAQPGGRILQDLPSATPSSPKSVVNGVETAVAGASVADGRVAAGSGSSSSSIVNHKDNIQASGSIASTITDHVRTLGPQVVQAAQMTLVIKELNYIATEIRDGNCLTASGGSGPDGYGRHVYDLIRSKLGDIQLADRRNHRFFVFHRDTIWYPAFDRLVAENPLPAEYRMKRKNLDTLCQDMQKYRRQLIRELDYGKDIVFHVLIPSWYKLCIREPLHFPEDLYPLQIEGELYHGEKVVEMNLPAAPPQLLHDIKNVLDPGNWDTIAHGAAIATAGPAAGWGANGACLALGMGIGTLTGFGLIAAVPFWFATAGKAMTETHNVIWPTVYNALREDAPRILGSNQRLPRGREPGMML